MPEDAGKLWLYERFAPFGAIQSVKVSQSCRFWKGLSTSQRLSLACTIKPVWLMSFCRTISEALWGFPGQLQAASESHAMILFAAWPGSVQVVGPPNLSTHSDAVGAGISHVGQLRNRVS